MSRASATPDTAELDALLRGAAPPEAVRALTQDDVDALAALVAAEHARRDAEGLTTLDAALAGFPWPVRKAIGKALGR